MSKKCSVCGTENEEKADFCQNCGNKLTADSAAPKESKGGFMGWWDKQTTLIKALSIIGVCCIGIIVIAGIVGMLSPDQTTSNTTVQNATPTPAPTTPAPTPIATGSFKQTPLGTPTYKIIPVDKTKSKIRIHYFNAMANRVGGNIAGFAINIVPADVTEAKSYVNTIYAGYQTDSFFMSIGENIPNEGDIKGDEKSGVFT